MDTQGTTAKTRTFEVFFACVLRVERFVQDLTAAVGYELLEDGLNLFLGISSVVSNRWVLWVGLLASE